MTPAPTRTPTSDIRYLEESRNAPRRSSESVNGAALLEGQVSGELAEDVGRFREANLPYGFRIITGKLEADRVTEGRGIYRQSNHRTGEEIVYTKGIGNLDAFGEDPNRRFGAFGSDSGSIFYDPLERENHYPRIIGAQSLKGAEVEILNAARILTAMSTAYNIHSGEAALAAGLTLPISAVHLASLTDHFAPIAAKEVKGSQWSGYVELGSSTLLVPSNRRYKGLIESGVEIDAAYTETLGRTIRNLISVANMVPSPISCTPGNFYAHKSSLCAQADNSDLLALEYWSPEHQEQLALHLISQLTPRPTSDNHSRGTFSNTPALTAYFSGLLNGINQGTVAAFAFPLIPRETLMATTRAVMKSADEESTRKTTTAYESMAAAIGYNPQLSGENPVRKKQLEGGIRRFDHQLPGQRHKTEQSTQLQHESHLTDELTSFFRKECQPPQFLHTILRAHQLLRQNRVSAKKLEEMVGLYPTKTLMRLL